MIDASIFKAYDIRGIYPDEINEDIARKAGNAFVAQFHATTVVVARDMRPSSVPLSNAFIEGAMLVARPYKDIRRLRSAASLLIDGLAVER